MITSCLYIVAKTEINQATQFSEWPFLDKLFIVKEGTLSCPKRRREGEFFGFQRHDF
jgi:hypothetical protein